MDCMSLVLPDLREFKEVLFTCCQALFISVFIKIIWKHEFQFKVPVEFFTSSLILSLQSC